MHGDLTADQQQELLTLGRISSAELMQNEASSISMSNVIVSPKHHWQAALNSKLKLRRQKALSVQSVVASNSSQEEQVQDCFKAEPVCISFLTFLIIFQLHSTVSSVTLFFCLKNFDIHPKIDSCSPCCLKLML